MGSLDGKRLVIFGCGYIGTAVAHAARAAGARVEALTRNPAKAEALRYGGLARVVVADLATSDWHREIKPGADLVLNAVSSGGADLYRHAYVDGMQSILRWAAQERNPIETFVYTSSTSVYPQGDGAIVSETCDAPGGTPNGAIIRESETLVEQAPRGFCFRWFILRLAGIYGPQRHHLLDQLRTGAPTLGGGADYRLNLVHRDDIVDAVMDCFRTRRGLANRIFNVVDSNPAPRGEVVSWLCGQLGRPVPTFDGTGGARRGGAPMPDRVVTHARIERELGWRPRYADYRAGFSQILREFA